MKNTWEIVIDEESKINVTRIETTGGIKFSAVYLLFLDEWMDIARIDNYPHEGKQGTHIHRFGEERVEFREMDLNDSIETVIRIGKSLKEKIKNASHRNC